jgi:hypothetical protein
MNTILRTIFLIGAMLSLPLLGSPIAPPDYEFKRLLSFIERFDELKEKGETPVGLISTARGDWGVLAMRRDVVRPDAHCSLAGAVSAFKEQFSTLFKGAYTYRDSSLRITYRHTTPWGGTVWIIGYTPDEIAPMAGAGFQATFFVPIYLDGVPGARVEPVRRGDGGR